MRASQRSVDTPTREEEILAAALDLFFRQGYRAASLRDLSAALDINVATLYHYFASKDQLLYRLQRDGIETLYRGAQAALAATAAASPTERLYALLRAHLRYHTDHYRLARLHYAEYRSLAPESRAIIRERMKEYERLVTSVVADGVARGEFHSQAPKITAFTLLGAGSQVAHWYQPGGELSAQTIVETVVELLMDGVRSRGIIPARRDAHVGVGRPGDTADKGARA